MLTLTDSPQRYGTPSKLLHWLSALLIIGMFGLGLWMVELGYYDPWYHRAPALHVSLGLLLAAITLLRLLWRLCNTAPAPLGSATNQTLARLGKWAMLALLLFMLASGYLITGAEGAGANFFDVFTLPTALTLAADAVDTLGELHEWAAWALILLTAGHALAALYHHVILHDATLARMLPLRPDNKHLTPKGDSDD